MARRPAARKVAHRKPTHRKPMHRKPQRRVGTLARIGAALSLPYPDVELAVASMANPDSGIKFVLGIARKAGKRASEVQSVIFDKLKWTVDAAQDWLKGHGFAVPKTDEAATFWRFRQQSPGKYKEFRTIVPGTRNPEMHGRYEHPAPKRDWRSEARTVEVTNGQEIVRLVLEAGGQHATSADGERFEYDGARWRDMANAEWTPIRGGRRHNAGTWPTIYKTRKAAQSAWSDSMPGRNDRARFVQVRGGYQVVPEGHFDDRGHFGTTVDDMERGDTGFVEENPRISTGLTWDRQKREQSSGNRWQLTIHHPMVPTRVFESLTQARNLVARAKSYKGSHYDIYDRGTGEFVESGVIGERENPDVADAISSYDEHLDMTTAPEFQEARPDEQAAAMTAIDLAENPPRRFPMPQDDSPASVRKVVDLVRSTTSLRTLHDAWEWAGQWNEGGDVWLPGDRAAGKPGIIGMISAKLARHGKSFDDLLRFEQNPYPDMPPDPEVTAWVDKVFHLPRGGVLWIPAHSKVMRSSKVSPGNYSFSVHDSPEDEHLLSFKSRRVRWASFKHQIYEEVEYFLRYGQLHPVSGRSGNPGDVHLRVYSAEEGADRNRDKLKALGFHTWVERAKRGNGYVWYLMVDQKNYAEAQRYFDGHEVQGTKQNSSQFDSQHPDLGQAAFDAGKDFRLSGAYAETGVSNARVAKVVFTGWYNNLSPQETKGHRKPTLLKNWMEGWAAGKRVEKRQGNPGVDERVITYDSKGRAVEVHLTTKRSSSSYGVPVAVIKGKSYGPGDQPFGKPLHVEVPSPALHPGGTISSDPDQPVPRTKTLHQRLVGRVGPSTDNAVNEWNARVGQGRRNPEAGAAQLYESFHGKPPGETLEIVTERTDHEWLTQLGTLVELKVATPSKLDATISFAKDADAPDLCSSEDGRQLYIEGGDQAVDLAALKMSGDKWVKDSMVLGVLYELTYQTEKGFHKFQLTDYFHKLGEETGVQPHLLYDPNNQLLSVSGGQYEIKPEGIIN